MQSKKISRRNLLKLVGAGSATLALAACAPAAPGTSSDGAGAAPGEAGLDMTIATFAAELHEWQREFASRWAEENSDVNLQIEEVVYGEMNKLQLARQASGTLWDLVFSGIKWFPFSASKGMFLALDDHLATRDDANLDDFFETALEGGKLDGSLYGLPYEIHPGNPALVALNLDLLEAAGVEPPTDDWNVNDYSGLAGQLADPDNNVFGTNYLPGNYYDFESLSRAYGHDLMDPERKQFMITDEINSEAARWLTSLRTDLNAAPPRTEVGTEGIDFISGVFGTAVTGSYSVNGWTQQIGDNFNVDWVLFPLGPEGHRGYTAFTSNFSVSAATADPDKAVDLLIYLSTTEAGLWSALEQGTGQPNARKSVWQDETLLSESHPIFERVLNKLYLADVQGPFPMPFNLRHPELQDNWANTSPDLFYGELPFEEGLQAVQDACQEIMDLPRA
ncbi:MAG: extracellular solute-binding protein [Chloroflexota bacterium]